MLCHTPTYNDLVIIDFKVADHFSATENFFSSYREHQYEFEKETGQIIIAQRDANVILKKCDNKVVVKSITVANMRRALELRHNLLCKITPAKNDIEIFLRKEGR